MKNLVKALGVAGVLAVTGTAHALTATSSFTVTATVLKACTVSATNIAFGNYTPGGGALTGNSTISVKCTKTTPYTVALNAGSGTMGQRTMINGAESLQYQLWTSAAFSTIFGDGTSASVTAASPVGGGAGLGAAAQTFTAFGQMPDSAFNQNAAPLGTNYSDTITVTVTY